MDFVFYVIKVDSGERWGTLMDRWIVFVKEKERLWTGVHKCITSKGNNKITELRTILQRESQNS